MGVWLPGGKYGGEGEMVRKFRINMYTRLYLKWITNKVLLASRGTYARYYVAASRGGGFGGESIWYMYD